MTSITDKERLDYAWKHFALISDQRVKTFNFYLIILLAAVSATIGAMKETTPRHIFCIIGCTHIFTAFLFALIDKRGCIMLGIACQALVEIEESEAFQGCKLLLTEDRKTNKVGWRYLISYRVAFGITFASQALFGCVLAWRPGYFVEQLALP